MNNRVKATARWHHIVPEGDAVILDRRCVECQTVVVGEKAIWHLRLSEDAPFFAGDVIRVLCDACKSNWPGEEEVIDVTPTDVGVA